MFAQIKVKCHILVGPCLTISTPSHRASTRDTKETDLNQGEEKKGRGMYKRVVVEWEGQEGLHPLHPLHCSDHHDYQSSGGQEK